MKLFDVLRFGAFMLFGSAIQAAETGDFDGDGRITLRDVITAQKYLFVGPEHFAPGSLELFADYPCFLEDSIYTPDYIGAATFLETLRRSVPGSLPTWAFNHWPETWLMEHPEGPLPSDARMAVRILDVRTAVGDEINIEIGANLGAPVVAFILILEGAEDVLRVPWLTPDHPHLTHLGVQYFGVLHGLNRIPHDAGTILIRAPEMGYLVTGGKYVITRGLEGFGGDKDVPPGDHVIVAQGRLARGAPAGSYPLRLSTASQVLFADGSLARPTMERVGTITIAEEVTTGWDGPVPPLEIDVKNRQVVGRIEFRFTDENGVPATPGEPLLTVAPGDSFTLRVQARTETPLNMLHFEFTWPLDVLSCDEEMADGMLVDEQLGEAYVGGRRAGEYCNWAHQGPARFGAWYYLGANWAPYGGKAYTSLYDRPMAYFEPLREWLDLWKVTLTVSPSAPEQIVPVHFRPADPHNAFDQRFREPSAEFAPYISGFYCLPAARDLWPQEGLWKYDVHYEDTSILIGGGETEPPLDLDIRILLGDATARPGEIVDVPVMASAPLDLYLLALAFSIPPEMGAVEAVRTQLAGRERYFWHTFEPDPALQYVHDCLPPDVCGGRPLQDCCVLTTPQNTQLRKGENGWLVEWSNHNPSSFHGAYPGKELFEVGRIVVQVSAALRAGDKVPINPAVVRLDHYGVPTSFESGGALDIFDRAHPFSPATEVRGGRIIIEEGPRFIRGDAYTDGRIDITDAVYILSHLFVGGDTPTCLQAADVDDDDAIVITDSIYLLGTLFLGQGPVSPPYPVCGVDPTVGTLSCEGPTSCP